MMKRSVIATLLRAGRPDLANVVAYRAVGALVLPPRKLEPFIKKLLGRLRKLDQDALAFHHWLDNIDKQHRDADGMEYNPVEYMILDHEWRVRGPGAFREVLEDFASSTFGSSERPLPEHVNTIERLWLNLKDWSAHDQLKGIGYIADDMERAIKSLERVGRSAAVFLRPNWIAQTLEEYEMEYGGYPVVVKRADLVRFDKIVKETVKLPEDLKDAVVRLRHMAAAAWQHYSDKSWKPESEKVETLYHASVDAKRIYQRGAFDPKIPEGKGLGGATNDKKNNPAISFTSDLYVAKEIARTLKEAIMIARREVSAADILDWSQRHGVIDDVKRTFESTYGLIDSKKTEHVMQLFRLYLTFHKTRYNPVFFGDMDRLMREFKKLKTSDVGVLKCQVDMTDPAISYHPAEHEYRVQPASVVSVDKLIR